MRVIAHISDLHFGKLNASAEALLKDLEKMRPSLIAISGDLTQRALTRQFMLARKFLNLLPAPFIVVPGNHDIPFYDITRRLLLPLLRYKHFISKQLNPLYHDNEISVIGLNTARSLKLENGKITKKQLDQMEQTFKGLHQPSVRIVVTHHPFVMPAGTKNAKYRKTVAGAAEAVLCFEKCEVDLVLSGHFHLSHTVDLRTSYDDVSRSMVHVQAGTAISKYVVHEPNSYNLISVSQKRMRIEVRECHDGDFHTGKITEYTRAKGQWSLVR